MREVVVLRSKNDQWSQWEKRWTFLNGVWVEYWKWYVERLIEYNCLVYETFFFLPPIITNVFQLGKSTILFPYLLWILYENKNEIADKFFIVSIYDEFLCSKRSTNWEGDR